VRAFGQAVRHERERNGISQDVFAEIAHVHRTYVGSVERGERNLTLKNIAAFSQALGLPASKLLAKAEALIDKRRNGLFADVSTG
jgi:transcriptional regulator with XRE-family HTH domain